MRKKALLAVLMAATLLLSSCTLIVKDEAVDNAREIIRMGDQVITKERVKKEIQNELDSMAYYYAQYGVSFDETDPEIIAQAQDAAVESLKQDLALTAKAAELELDKLSEEELAEVQEKAQADYDNALYYVKNYMLTDTEGQEEEALNQSAADMLTGMDITLDTYTESETRTLVDNKLREYAIRDVAVTEEELQAEYDSKVEDARTAYADNPGSYATAANNSSTLYYAPAGVRRVKQILIQFGEEDQTAISDAKQLVTDANTAVTAAQAKIDSADELLALEEITEEEKAKATEDREAAEKELEEANASLEAANQAVEDATNKAYESIDEETDAVLASLAEGADWQTLMDEKNQDPGMKTHENGYAVAADMTGFDSAFVEAAMALEKPGDISGKVRGSSNGYYIIRYDSDEPEGPVSLDAVRDTLTSSLLTTKQNDAYTAAVEQWVEAAGIKVDLNALKD